MPVAVIELKHHYAETDELRKLLIEDQIQKCKEKVEPGDYFGAITDARSLDEEVCAKIEQRV